MGITEIIVSGTVSKVINVVMESKPHVSQEHASHGLLKVNASHVVKDITKMNMAKLDVSKAQQATTAHLL